MVIFGFELVNNFFFFGRDGKMIFIEYMYFKGKECFTIQINSPF